MGESARLPRLLRVESSVGRVFEEADLARLNDAERGRAELFRFEQDRVDFVAAHLLARDVIAQFVDVEVHRVRLTQTCSECHQRGHGAPWVEVGGRSDVYVSWSHTRGRIAAVAADRAVGIDIEPLHGPTPEGGAGPELGDLVQDALTPAEQSAVLTSVDPGTAFRRVWTRKEALVKVGATSLDDFATTDVGDRPRWGDWALEGWVDPTHEVVVGLATAWG